MRPAAIPNPPSPIHGAPPEIGQRDNSVLGITNAYRQIERDNPRLVWLFTLMLEEDIELPAGEILSAMKQRVLAEEGLVSTAWRWIANGAAEDFGVVLGPEDPSDEYQWRWHRLVAWLQILSGLRLRCPLPAPIQELFRYEGLVVMPESDEVLFHGTWMRFGILRRILEEAEKRLKAGTLQAFAEKELVSVLAWLATDPESDKNQEKSGWKNLARRAQEWEADQLDRTNCRGLEWSSALPVTQVGRWVVTPIADAWAIRQLAISQHHCADRFIESCLANRDRIFTIRETTGNIAATLRLIRDEEKWVVGELKGFANSAVATPVCSLGKEIAQRYTDASLRPHLTGKGDAIQ